MSGKYRQNYDESKFVGSFDLHSIPCENRLLPAKVRPSADGTYYTVILNGSFFGHLTKDDEVWIDLSGKQDELIEVIGKMIEERKE
jgi:hypothetical protein